MAPSSFLSGKFRQGKWVRGWGESPARPGGGSRRGPCRRRDLIALAMGHRGDTVVILISDDNFITMVRAVEEGRLV